MRRDWLLLLAGLAVTALTVAAAAAGVEAWAGLYPRSPALARLATWPLVGEWVARVRDRHAGAPPRPSPPATRVRLLPPRPDVGWPAVVVPPATAASEAGPPDLPAGVWPERWLVPGDRLHAEPSAAAPTVAVSTAITNVPVLAAAGPWRRVRWHGQEGWVLPPPEGAPPMGSAPEPVRPVPGRPPAPERLAAARTLLTELRVGDVGPYPLLTDVDEPALMALLGRAASTVETAYRQRYGVTPIGTPAETVVLFRRRAAYEAYVAKIGAAVAESGHVGSGVVALYREGRLMEDVRTTLVHELVHLLNRRAIGPALPPWLDEGIANDLAESRMGEAGQPIPGTVDVITLPAGGGIYELHGAAASRQLLQRARAGGGLLPLRQLVQLAEPEFYAVDRRPLDYAEASFLIRYLLAGDHASSFRTYLRQVSEGTPTTPETLAAALGLAEGSASTWDSLDADYRAWIDTAPPPLPTPPPR